MKLWEFIKNEMLESSMQTINENNAQMTYEETVIFVEEFSKKIRGEKCCAIICNSEMMSAIALLCCFCAGVTALPLSLRYGELHCNKILDRIKPTAVITDYGEQLQVTRITNSKYQIPTEFPAIIMCTSGTTGKPKGVMLSENNIISNVKDISDYFNIGCSDSILITRPIYHCAVITGELIVSLIKGVKIRFYSEEFSPSKTLELINNYKISVFCGTPTFLSMMSRLKRNYDSPLKHICVSGECMDKETALKIAESFSKSKIYHVYGLTEACPRVAYLPPELFSLYPEYVGFPLKNVSIKIMNDVNECKPGEEGVLWVKGENVMMGYFDDLKKTKDVMNGKWLCTGDIAVMNKEGLIKIKGRNDQMIIKAGMNIYPTEIETAIKFDERVKEVMVYGFKNKYGIQIGMKIVGDFNNTNEVKKLCQECMPTFQIPTLIELVEKLPKNASGKIVRK